jgi:hypothetical protein
MLTSNGQRLEVWLGLKNKFDYQAFSKACLSKNIEPLPAMEFAQKAGLIMCGMTAYPDLPEAEAYLKYIRENPLPLPTTSAPIASQVVPRTPSTNCQSCGGGKVR